jgi:hypothetical protein
MRHSSKVIEVYYRKFVIYDSGVLGDPCRFYAAGVAAPGVTLPDTGASPAELKEKLAKHLK